MIKQIALESFQWAQQLYPILKQYEDKDGVAIYKVIAATSDIKNDNGRVYTQKQHEFAAASLSERPLNIDHEESKTLPFPENEVVAARYEDGHVECLIQVADPETKRMIENGEITHVSVEGIYLDDSNNTSDTEYPTSLHYRALALLSKANQPGDPQTKIFQDRKFFTEKLQSTFEKVTFTKKVPMINSSQEAQWSASQVNDFPDSSFAAIEPGGKKDEEGKTTPRSLRHLPYKDASGKPDAAHVRNALARLSQTQIAPQLKAAARKKLVVAAKELGIDTSLDEAYRNYKIAKEILRSYLEDLSDPLLVNIPPPEMSLQQSHAQRGSMAELESGDPTGEPAGPVVPAGKSPGKSIEPPNAPNIPSQSAGLQNDFSADQVVTPSVQQVPGATTSQQEAQGEGSTRITPDMNPHTNNPGAVLSQLSTTSMHHGDLQVQDKPQNIEEVAGSSFRFKGRKVKIALIKK